MAILNSVNLSFAVFGDDTSTVFNLNLTTDCYTIVDVALGAPVINWSSSTPVLTLIPAQQGVYSGTINKGVVAVTFATPPPSQTPTIVSFYLILPSKN